MNIIYIIAYNRRLTKNKLAGLPVENYIEDKKTSLIKKAPVETGAVYQN